jgi:transcriptional regulator
MYTPSAFAEDDLAWQQAQIRAHGFGVVTSMLDGHLTATHLPFLLDETRGPKGTLLAHMARANPHWRGFDGRTEALIVFAGPHAYVSPTWYTTAPAVPTWNYVAVHVHGTPVVKDDAADTRAHLARLATTFEAGRDRPWRLEDQPDAYIDGMIKAVIAFEIEITRIEGKAKLSQNRPAADRAGVVAGLRADGETALADVMDK